MDESLILGGSIRKIWPSEREKFLGHLLRLDNSSRRMRFGMMVNDDFIEDYAARTDSLNSLVFGYFVGDDVRAASELRPLGPSVTGESEAAFSVEKPYQNSGIGTALLGRIIRSARNRGVRRLYMNCLAENRRMQRIARKYDADLQFEVGDVVGEVEPLKPNYLTFWKEVVDDEFGFVMAILEIQKRLIPAT